MKSLTTSLGEHGRKIVEGVADKHTAVEVYLAVVVSTSVVVKASRGCLKFSSVVDILQVHMLAHLGQPQAYLEGSLPKEDEYRTVLIVACYSSCHSLRLQPVVH